MSKPTYEELEEMLYTCLVKFANDDEDAPLTVYERVYKALDLPTRTPELKARMVKAEADYVKAEETVAVFSQAINPKKGGYL